MSATQTQTTPQTNAYSLMSPRFWHGMRAVVWWRLVARNHFRIAPHRAHLALGVSSICPANDVLAGIQRLFYESQIQATQFQQAPVFILGHWRSGTTLLHELLVTNPELTCPTTYQCFAPSHFLISPWIPKYGGFLVPEKRPMDNMAAGWYLPQEDEFALMNLGVPTPYLRLAFPQTQPLHLEYLDMTGLTSSQLQHWKDNFLWFLKAVTLANQGKRLVLKSPPHTGRLKLLFELFPEARFIHLTRDPRQLFPSTMRLWSSLDQVQSLQDSYTDAEMKRYVAECLRRMYAGYDAARPQIPENQIVDLRYEDLVADPLSTVRMLYDRLQLGDFGAAAPNLKKILAGHDQYQTNRHRDDPEWEREVLSYCSDYARRYGYV